MKGWSECSCVIPASSPLAGKVKRKSFAINPEINPEIILTSRPMCQPAHVRYGRSISLVSDPASGYRSDF
jgi:hypothetical protein